MIWHICLPVLSHDQALVVSKTIDTEDGNACRVLVCSLPKLGGRYIRFLYCRRFRHRDRPASKRGHGSRSRRSLVCDPRSEALSIVRLPKKCFAADLWKCLRVLQGWLSETAFGDSQLIKARSRRANERKLKC